MAQWLRHFNCAWEIQLSILIRAPVPEKYEEHNMKKNSKYKPIRKLINPSIRTKLLSVMTKKKKKTIERS